MTTDRLTLAHVIEDAGIARDKAERLSSAIFDAITDQAATKQDLQRVEDNLRSEIQTVRAEIARIADRTLIRLSGVMVVLLGILFAALKGHP